MSKLNYKDKINLYNDKKNGLSLNQLVIKYKVNPEVIKYLTRLIDRHGFDIIRTSSNKKYNLNEKLRIINRVLLNNETIKSVAVDEGLSSYGMLSIWISKYKENGYNIVERKRGRSPTIMAKNNIKSKSKETIEEENERLKKENLYLKAELEYSKKLRAVVQVRKNQQQKKK